MICQDCKVEAAIMDSGYEVEGDNSPATPTKVFSVLKFRCRNKACPKCGREIGVVRHEIYTQGTAEKGQNEGKEDAV